MTQQNPEFLTIAEVAELLRLSVPQIRRLVRQGRIPFAQPGGPRGKLLFPSDVQQQLVEQPADVPTPESNSSPSRRPAWLK